MTSDINKAEVELVNDAANAKDIRAGAMGTAELDNAVGYREYLEGMDLEGSNREIDLIILPMFLITQALQFMDKTSLNYANLFGYQAALGLEGKEFNYLSARGATCLWAVLIWFFMADSPSNAHFLNHRERLLAVKRVAGNQTGIKNKHFDKGQVHAGFMDPKTILLFIGVFAA
ncbi:hypothetical protein N0V90_009918 [Kalmusia sp. IMI 367209]|nr:hypothetical protein N0V90_009918 [Kalmusia sp. IMI 367209]